MFKNYLKVAARNLLKHKTYSLITVLGLAVGIAASVLISLYVFDELGYDRFHRNAGRIYRLTADWSNKGDSRIHQLGTPYVLAKTLRDKYPQVEAVAQVSGPVEDVPLRHGANTFKASEAYLADDSFFRVFSFPLEAGDTATCLRAPGSVVLTRSTAVKLFGTDDPIGKSVDLLVETRPQPLQVTGVMADVPVNSHFRFGMLISSPTYYPKPSMGWTNNNYTTYLLARPGVDRAEVARILVEIDAMHFDGGRKHIPWIWTPVPLTRVHLDSDLATGAQPNGSAVYVRLFAAAALLILVIAGINFVNLATARSIRRAKEVGIRKVVGSRKGQLVGQFLGESVVTALTALVLGIGLIHAALPFYRRLTGRVLGLPYFSNPWVIPALIGLALAVGLLSGLYPAFVLSSFRHSDALKGNRTTGSGRRALLLRNGLVVFQFAISVLLIMGSTVISRQLDYVRNRRLGFDKDHVVVVHNIRSLGPVVATLKDKLARRADVRGTTAVGSIPGSGTPNWGIRVEGVQSERPLNMDFMTCDEDFASTLDIRMLEGRFLSRDFPSDKASVIINRQAKAYFGLDDPIGRKVRTGWGPQPERTIVGVMDDVQFESLHQPVNRMGYILSAGDGFPPSYLLVRVDARRTYDAIDGLRREWESLSTGLPFEFTFLDQRIAALYENDVRAGRVVSVFSLLAVFISALGLFGLAAYVTEQRTKEIGVRKVLGAGFGNLVWLVAGQFLKWVAVAVVIAWPLGYYLMSGWLRGFAARMDLTVGIFVASGLAALIVAALTVGSQVVRSASADPVDCLRYE